MKNCLNCTEEFEEKRETAKFCSTSCRVMYNRKHGKNGKIKEGVKESKIDFIYTAVLGLIEAQKSGLPADYVNWDKVGVLKPDGSVEELSFDKLRVEFEEQDSKPTYLSLLNGMGKLLFADERDEYAEKIKAATYLTEKQQNDLLNHLKQMR